MFTLSNVYPIECYINRIAEVDNVVFSTYSVCTTNVSLAAGIH